MLADEEEMKSWDLRTLQNHVMDQTRMINKLKRSLDKLRHELIDNHVGGEERNLGEVELLSKN